MFSVHLPSPSPGALLPSGAAGGYAARCRAARARATTAVAEPVGLRCRRSGLGFAVAVLGSGQPLGGRGIG